MSFGWVTRKSKSILKLNFLLNNIAGEFTVEAYVLNFSFLIKMFFWKEKKDRTISITKLFCMTLHKTGRKYLKMQHSFETKVEKINQKRNSSKVFICVIVFQTTESIKKEHIWQVSKYWEDGRKKIFSMKKPSVLTDDIFWFNLIYFLRFCNNNFINT